MYILLFNTLPHVQSLVHTGRDTLAQNKQTMDNLLCVSCELNKLGK